MHTYNVLNLDFVLLHNNFAEKVIQIEDKSFVPFISEADIQSRIVELAQDINKEYEGKDLIFIAVLNGAFMFAADLMKSVHLPSEISFVKVSSYRGVETTGRVDELIGLNTEIDGKHVVIIEDIVDTGITIDKIVTLLKSHDPASVKISTLLYKPDAFKGKNKPDFVGFTIENKFVVGYGLDYNEKGRNLSEILQVQS